MGLQKQTQSFEKDVEAKQELLSMKSDKSVHNWKTEFMFYKSHFLNLLTKEI